MGVDPVPLFDVTELQQGVRFSSEPSDDFFAGLQSHHRFDLVFLDGLHERQQAYRDLIHTLMHTSPHAVILVDDVVPGDQWSAVPDQAESLRLKLESGILDTRWHGDVFKVILAIQRHHPELDFRMIQPVGIHNDNAETVIWRSAPAQASTSAAGDTNSMSEIDALEYSDSFGGGHLPDSFRPTSEAEALETALTGSLGVWQSQRNHEV